MKPFYHFTSLEILYKILASGKIRLTACNNSKNSIVETMALDDALLKLFNELDLRATRYSQLYNQNYNRKRSYIITIRGVEMFHKFMKVISPKNPKHIKKYKYFLNSQNL